MEKGKWRQTDGTNGKSKRCKERRRAVVPEVNHSRRVPERLSVEHFAGGSYDNADNTDEGKDGRDDEHLNHGAVGSFRCVWMKEES
jgi:hypothetical protein